jgi:hypothetical protein
VSAGRGHHTTGDAAPGIVSTDTGETPSCLASVRDRRSIAGSAGSAAATRRAWRESLTPSIVSRHTLPAIQSARSTVDICSDDSPLESEDAETDIVTTSATSEGGIIPGARSGSSAPSDVTTSVISRRSSPKGSGAAHGQTTSGGVMNFTSTTTHSACLATGPMRPNRQTSATVAASAAVVTRL